MFKCFKDRERVREKDREVFLLSKVYYTFVLLAVFLEETSSGMMTH